MDKKKVAVAVLAAAVLTVGTGWDSAGRCDPVQVRAEDTADGTTPAADTAQMGFSIVYEGTPEGASGPQPLTGMPVEVYHVADAKGELTEDFFGTGMDMDALQDADAVTLLAAAESAARYAGEYSIDHVTQETDEEGRVRFDGLEAGVYLAVPSETWDAEEGTFLNIPFLISIPLDGEDFPEAQAKVGWSEGVVIGLRDLTIYTGGNELESDQKGGFPEPRYTGIPSGVQFASDGEPWEGEGYPFEVYYTVAEENPDLSLTDTGVTAPNDTEPGLYIAHIRPVEEGARITCSTDGFLHEEVVSFETAVLTVRNVYLEKNEDQLGEIVSVASGSGDGLSQWQREDLDHGLAAVTVPENSEITVNGDGTLGITALGETAILFDEVLYYEQLGTTDGVPILEVRTEEAVEQAGGKIEGRQYEAKYLDLVDYTDGNLWVSSSNGSYVYWPYPEGTDENTEFQLVHFIGLHREYGIKGNDEMAQMAWDAPTELIDIENTGEGIRFYIPRSGFSPFVLTWVGDGTGGSTIQDLINGVIHGVKTGDMTTVLPFAAVLLISGGVIICIVRARKKKMEQKIEQK